MIDNNPMRNPIIPRTMLSKDDNSDATNVTKFKQAIGSLIYLIITRPNLMFKVSLISSFMTNPKDSHWVATKRLLRCLR